MQATGGFDKESVILCWCFSPSAHLEKKGLLVCIRQPGWPETWPMAPRARELLSGLPDGVCLKAV